MWKNGRENFEEEKNGIEWKKSRRREEGLAKGGQ